MSVMNHFCIFCAFFYADTVSLVSISCEYFAKMLNDVLDKIIYWLMMKESFWHDLNPCPSFWVYDVTDFYILSNSWSPRWQGDKRKSSWCVSNRLAEKWWPFEIPQEKVGLISNVKCEVARNSGFKKCLQCYNLNGDILHQSLWWIS